MIAFSQVFSRENFFHPSIPLWSEITRGWLTPRLIVLISPHAKSYFHRKSRSLFLFFNREHNKLRLVFAECRKLNYPTTHDSQYTLKRSILGRGKYWEEWWNILYFPSHSQNKIIFLLPRGINQISIYYICKQKICKLFTLILR